ncbi:MAG: tetratricopeptide repeat protein [Fibrobacteria bacterium]
MTQKPPVSSFRSKRSAFPVIRALLLGLLMCVSVFSRSRNPELSEDSLQAMVAQEPDNPVHWMKLGSLAANHNQVDLAKGYFDEAIKLSGNQGKTILEVGDLWLSQGRIMTSLPYLMPNLAHLDPARLDQLQNGLEKEGLPSAQLLVLRNLGSRTQSYHPVNRKTAVIAFRLGDYPLCQSVLARYADQLDFESSRNLLLLNFFLNGALDARIPAALHKRYPHGEMGYLASLNNAQQARWREVREFLKREANSPSYRDYYNLLKAMEAAAEDRNEEAAESYQKALETPWDRLRVVVHADLYRLYSSTGNKFKSDQIWESIKEDYQNLDPDLQEFMARQLQVRGYEKQSKYFYRVVLRRKPGNAVALAALWEDLLGNEDYQTISENLKALLDREPLSCEGNTLAMQFHYRQNNDKELLPYGRNATVYCFEAVEPYFILGSTLMNLSKPEEAKSYFATFIRKGGDVNKVPMSVR